MSGPAQCLLRLRRTAEECLEAGRDAAYLALVDDLRLDAELWPHVWAPQAALAAHRAGRDDAFDFLDAAADGGFTQLEIFSGRLEAAFGDDPRFAAFVGRVRANVPAVPIEIHEWPDPMPTWPLAMYRTTPEREILLRQVLPQRSDSAWQTARRLTTWVSQQWAQANVHVDGGDAVDILRTVEDGARYDAREYAVVLAQGLNALGIPARRTGLRQREHHVGAGRGYVVAEAWIDDLDRWVLLDGEHGAIWVDGADPLSALDLQRRFHAGVPAPQLVRSLDRAPMPDADFWYSYFSSVDTTGFGWSSGGAASPVFQGTGIISMPRLVRDPSLAYPRVSEVGIGLSGNRERPLVDLLGIHPHALGFYVEDAAGPSGTVPLSEPRFVLPTTPGRHDIAIHVVTAYGRCRPSHLRYTCA